MILKVCGIKYEDNLREMERLPIDMIGFNFYSPSSRFLDHMMLPAFPRSHIEYVGVFVNESEEKILKKVKEYQLDIVQLHGNESPKLVKHLSKVVKVIKVFSIKEPSDFDTAENYADAHMFLFDTKTPEFGGSGRKFQWELLDHYSGKKPFLLAGGIGPEDIDSIININHPQLMGVDINSKFEIKPGRKDPELVEPFARKCSNIQLKTNNNRS
jgi:phosphoribosylanthranilate isomerase